ncbi:NADH-quinone oxidoreductase subunit NuoH [Archaeoglobus veneficus]|uniref:NADH dehydrogenase (Quinone) n=1 Tax=Archaeoglobus veneficus (strain DSM 11195 / SNP6) TaxID=693661 RepID=F2KQC2_ARCVS|nr:NADH-quinone oxidoreductase subunit NuoH [Archaeoglobus veneficus]AEA46555.1 NADH dehydrogenase (quinone) [Archaeoglobus veneficus SNP6]
MSIGYNELLNMFRENMVSIPLLTKKVALFHYGGNVVYLNSLADAFANVPLLNFIVALLFWKPLFAVLFIPGLTAIMLSLLFIIWFERKVTARVQWRYGPVEVSRNVGGIIQPLADGMRYFFQEVIVHREAHRPYFLQFPLISFLPVLLPILVIPAGAIYAIRTPYAIPAAIGLIALVPIIIVAIGWASNSKYAYIGSMREVFMYFAYEIALIIAAMAMVIAYGSSDAFVIVEKQSLVPGIVLNPFACLAFFVATVMATSRFPFEIPEADQEVVFGPFIEYTGIIFGVVMTLAYEKLYLLSLLLSILFLGGWNGPHIACLGDLSPALWLFLKTVGLMMIFVFFRTFYGRYRLDQAIRIGWSSLLALSLISLLVGIGIGFAGWL